MLTPTQANALLHRSNTDQRRRLQPAYNAASARLESRWNTLRRSFEGAYKALLAKAQEPNISRARVQFSAEYAEYKRLFTDAAQQFVSTVRVTAETLERDGIDNGATFAYNALAAGGERPQRVEAVRMRYTQSADFALILVRFAQNMTDKLDDKWRQASVNGLSAKWAVKEMGALSETTPVVSALTLVRTIQLTSARATTLQVYRGQQ